MTWNPHPECCGFFNLMGACKDIMFVLLDICFGIFVRSSRFFQMSLHYPLVAKCGQSVLATKSTRNMPCQNPNFHGQSAGLDPFRIGCLLGCTSRDAFCNFPPFCWCPVEVCEFSILVRLAYEYGVFFSARKLGKWSCFILEGEYMCHASCNLWVAYGCWGNVSKYTFRNQVARK